MLMISLRIQSMEKVGKKYDQYSSTTFLLITYLMSETQLTHSSAAAPGQQKERIDKLDKHQHKSQVGNSYSYSAKGLHRINPHYHSIPRPNSQLGPQTPMLKHTGLGQLRHMSDIHTYIQRMELFQKFKIKHKSQENYDSMKRINPNYNIKILQKNKKQLQCYFIIIRKRMGAIQVSKKQSQQDLRREIQKNDSRNGEKIRRFM